MADNLYVIKQAKKAIKKEKEKLETERFLKAFTRFR